ncbi:hypothetical protein C8A01DRAFT_41263 [Parachaetomium inaequale]|uniref:Uncharacterized protein n=1 Tax=Parachaetomium inaequale TaxID=2588326 RepID=A0AAN6P7M1_9PEZI|nr:hypothetical protein C8A01DRAFT_41263 [Parachaetomium inaequale]
MAAEMAGAAVEASPLPAADSVWGEQGRIPAAINGHIDNETDIEHDRNSDDEGDGDWVPENGDGDGDGAGSGQGKKTRKARVRRASVHIDPFKSPAVSLDYLLTPEKWKGLDLAPVEEAVARMRGECENNKQLIKAITKYLEGFHEGVSQSGKPVYSNNTRVRVMKEKLEASLGAHINNEALPYVPTKPEILAARYCHPKGELNATIGSMLGAMGFGNLIPVQSYDQSTGIDGSHDAQNRRDLKDEILADVSDLLDGFVAKHEGSVTNDEFEDAMHQTRAKTKNVEATVKAEVERTATAMVKAEVDKLQIQVGKDLEHKTKETKMVEDKLTAEITALKAQVEDLSTKLAASATANKLTGDVSASLASEQQAASQSLETPEQASSLCSRRKRTRHGQNKDEEERPSKRITGAANPTVEGAKYGAETTRCRNWFG